MFDSKFFCKILFCQDELVIPLDEVVLSLPLWQRRTIHEHLTNGLFHEVEWRSFAKVRSFFS